jgi:transcription initiation factor TFIIH subunit 2
MAEKDLRPTRHLLTIHYAQEFVREYFEQNPISQLGIIGMRDGLAIRVSDVSGNPEEHIAALQALREQEPKGNPSLQNALEMAKGALYHAPSHGTREVLIILGATYTVDPGDIHDTIKALVSAHIICTVVGLSAEVAICRTLVARTNPSTSPQNAYSVAMDEQHYKELFMAATTPPPIAASTTSSEPENAGGTLLRMGFPSRIVTPYASLCACHSQPTRDGYLCPRCNSKACSLPTECRVCGFTLILSTHLARSYHHLFPLLNWVEVPWKTAQVQSPPQLRCFGCQTLFPEIPPEKALADAEAKKKQASLEKLVRAQSSVATVGRSEQAGTKVVNASLVGKENSGISESGRYACPTCDTHFCIDCDLFSHAETHNCPGCLAKASSQNGHREVNGVNPNGLDAMDVDPPSASLKAGKNSTTTKDGNDVNKQILELLKSSLDLGDG